jgi:hypothetical protein
MKIGLRIALIGILAFCIVGCHRRQLEEKDLPFANVSLGMAADAATKAVGKEGAVCDENKLPVQPGPHTLFPHIPAETTWHVWWRDDKTAPADPSLILGIFENRIVTKWVWYKDGDKWSSLLLVPPEYQK